MAKRAYKILIIDDDKFMLKTLELAFADTAYRTKTVASPIKAYKMIEDEHFDIVISDIVMPKMDGIKLLEKIKDYNGMIQVIMITAEITVNNTIKAFRKGAVDIFFKPLEDLKEIVRAVDQIAVRLDRVNAILKRVIKEKGKK